MEMKGQAGRARRRAAGEGWGTILRVGDESRRGSVESSRPGRTAGAPLGGGEAGGDGRVSPAPGRAREGGGSPRVTDGARPAGEGGEAGRGAPSDRVRSLRDASSRMPRLSAGPDRCQHPYRRVNIFFRRSA